MGSRRRRRRREGGREGQTRQLLVLVLVVFVAVSVRCDVGASFCVSNELHLVGVFFYAYLAEIPQSAQDCRHFVKCVRMKHLGLKAKVNRKEANDAPSVWPAKATDIAGRRYNE